MPWFGLGMISIYSDAFSNGFTSTEMIFLANWWVTFWVTIGEL